MRSSFCTACTVTACGVPLQLCLLSKDDTASLAIVQQRVNKATTHKSQGGSVTIEGKVGGVVQK